ncbi:MULTISPECIES: DUF4184 family protein [unclassified Streptomyces]|uniref:DUF4184 family protein n=1 Tax=unclassified Streptomyces TaxID=2593676 RepID=UPI00036AD067|nr:MULTISPECIES: DUF4184 family protein [unclassified Streptomyces]MYT27922.1 DUF4184 family protein [Streptomyces sp. SID8354]
MPFTLSHAAAVLPFLRRTGTARGPLVASALVAGSFAPDVTYYAATVVPGGMEFGTVTHSPAGVVTVDVLLSAVLAGGWLLVREPLRALLPRAGWTQPAAVARGRPRLPHTARERALAASWFVVSAVLGAATHVGWDAFTHPGRWGARLLPVLDTVVAGRPLAMYLQYTTSALGLAVVGWFLWAASRARRATGTGGAGLAPPELPLRLRLSLTAVAALGMLLGGGYRTLRAYALHGAAVGWFDYLPDLLFGAGAGLVPGLLVCAAALRLRNRRARRGTATADGSAPGRPAGAEAGPA